MNLDVYEHVLKRFPDAKWNGDRGMARCPAHEDRTPSVSFWLARNGALLFGCWAGCDKAAVMAKAGITWRDCFPPRTDADRDRLRPRFVCAYQYRDLNGALLYETVRFDPKDFRQRRPAPGPGRRWVWGVREGWYAPRPGKPDLYPTRHADDPGAVHLPDVAYVLYRHPQLMLARRQNPNRMVLVVSGEKDADTADRVGMVATTNVSGERAPWLTSYCEPLVGADVVVVHDNDATGKDRAAHVAGCLLTAECGSPRSLRVGRMPGVGPKGDLSDWVAGVESRGLPVIPAAADAFRGFRCFKRA